MPTVFSHAAASVAIGKVYARREMPPKFWLLSAACAVLPDADVVGFAFGFAYGDMLGHRGLTHSLAFAAALALTVVLLFFRDERALSRRWWSLVCYFAFVTASHGVLDALTDGGLGVAFFAPFSARRYFLPWQPIEVSPIGLDFFGRGGLAVLGSEFVWVWLPSLLLVAAAQGARKLLKWRATAEENSR